MNETNDVNILIIINMLKKQKWFILWTVLICTAASIIGSLIWPVTFEARATLLPITKMGNDSDLSKLGETFAGFGGMLSALSEKATNKSAKTFLAILGSRTVTKNVIEKENLFPMLSRRFNQKRGKEYLMERSISTMLEEHVEFEEHKKLPTVIIKSYFKEPTLAANVSNRYISELQNFINGNNLTVAKRNRIFTKAQLEANKSDLLTIGKDLSTFYQQFNVSNTNEYIDVPRDIERQLIKSPIASVKEGDKDKSSTISVPQGVYYDYLTMQKRVLSSVNSFLSTQYELAKIEEEKEGLAFQVLDQASPPPLRYSPKRKLIVLIALFGSAFLAIFLAYIRESLKEMKNSNA